MIIETAGFRYLAGGFNGFSPGIADPWRVGAFAVAAMTLLPVITILLLAFFPSENIWPHLISTTLPKYIGNTLLLLGGVGVSVLIKAIKEGRCDVAVINHYYLHKMANNEKQKAWAEAVNVVFPNQDDRGAHMNISGMAMTKHAPNRDNALKLMEFLAGDRAQKMYAEVNGEYPVNENIDIGDYLKSLGAFKRDTLALSLVAANRAEASKMADRVGYND